MEGVVVYKPVEEIITSPIKPVEEFSHDIAVVPPNDALAGAGLGTHEVTGVVASEGSELEFTTEPMSLVSVDKQPEFPGGEQKFLDFLANTIRYPGEALTNDVTGRVYASFIINANGSVESVKIIRGLGFGLDGEVIRVLKLSPQWSPGKFKGKPVSTIIIVPVLFQIKK